MTTTFADLPLHGDVQRALASMRFYAPSPIQLRALPLALFGNDVIGQAKSGTGKTAVFGVTAVEHVIAKCDARVLQQASGTTPNTESSTQYTLAIAKHVDPLALILAPTREIATQIDAVIRQIARFRPACAIQTVIGGLPVAQDRENLKHGCHVVIGTPGRVKALIEQRILQCHALRLLILDEVDKLMQSDFERETLAFSATFTTDQLATVARMMRSPQIVRVRGPQDVTVELVSSLEELTAWAQREESNQPELWLRHVKQFYSIVPKRPADQLTNGNSNSDALGMSSKIVKLAALLSEIVFNQCIVFCNDKFRAEALATALAAQGWPAVCITGSQSQATRTQVMESFRAFQARVLVSTDLTARGIDIDRVNFVVNLDLPRDPATYLHRVGRTGRFGGRISFLLCRVCLNLDPVRDEFNVVILYGLAVTLLAENDVVAVEMLARVFKMSIDELPEPVPRAIYDFVKEKSADRSEDVEPGAPELENSLTTTPIGEGKEVRGEEKSIERSQKVEMKPKLLGNLKMKSSGVTHPSSETRISISSGESESELGRQQDPTTEKLSIPIQEQQPPVAPESSENPSKVLPTSVSANSTAIPLETSTRKSETTRSIPPRSATHTWEEECYARWTALLSRAKKRTLRSKKLISGSASMWGWLTGNSNGNGNGSGSGGGRHRLGSIFSRPREFTLASMRHLHAQLLKFAELGDAEIVELLRVLSEFLIYSDQNHGPDDDGSGGGGGHDSDASSAALSPPRDSLEALEFERTTSSAGVFFDYFCEKNILGLFVQLGASKPSVAVQIQLLQTMSILVQNIATRTSLYYILSNNYVNKLLECPFAVMKEDDVRDWYVTLLKALSLRLNEETVQFFFDDSSANAFPLYSQALKFKRCSETMVKVAVKTLTLNVYKVQDDRVRQFILAYQKMAYFRDIVEYANELALKIQGLLNLWSPSMAQTLIEKLEEAIDEYIDHCFYLQDILDVNLPELCYKVGDLIYKRHVRKFLAASVLPDCNPPPQRVSTRLALYLLTRLTGIFEHAPLVNAISFMLLSPDASERCPYSAVALGAGSRRKTARKSTTAKPGQASTTGNTATAAIATPATAKRKGSKKKAHVFQAHSAAKCDSPLCYLQTRFSEGEWPLDEVEKFVPSQPNCFRQSILALIASSDEILSSEALLLILAIVNNDAVDHTLLRELDLLPFRHRKHRRSGGGALGAETTGAGVAAGASLDAARLTVSEETGGSGESVDSGAEEAEENETEDQEQAQLENNSVVSSTSSSDLSVLSTSQVEEDDDDNDNDENDTEDAGAESDNNSSDETKATLIAFTGGRLSDASSTHSSSSSESYVGQYPHWLMDTILSILAKNPETRLLSTQLAARLLVDIMLDPQRNSSSGAATGALHHWLLPRHGAVLKEIHSVSTHQVMESMRGAMADVDLFIYVLEDEFEDFQRTKFPMALNFKNASPFEFLIPPVLDFISDRKGTLNLRSPSNEMEVCRKSMRVFLTLRKLRALLDEHYCADNLDQFVAFRHPHTSLLESVTPSGRRKRAMLHTSSSSSSSSTTTVPLEGMVFLKCIWREQRFLHSPAKLLMVLNPEALVFVEKQAAETAGDNNKDDIENDANQGFVRLFAPIHRTYCSIDAKDDRVLHVTISSAVPVDGCRSYHKGSVKSSRSSSGTSAQQQLGELKSWHVSVLFENREDCRQAKAHVDLSRAEVRAFKLLQIEESLTTHVQITHSANAVSPKTKARKLSMDVEERRLKQEEQEQA